MSSKAALGLPVVPLPLSLQVRNLHRDARDPPHVKGLFDRAQQSVVLVAHVRRVRIPGASQHARQLHQLPRVGEAARRVLQTRRQPDAASAELFGEELFHGLQLRTGCGPVITAHDESPQRPVPDHRRDSDGRTFAPDPFDEARRVAEVDLDSAAPIPIARALELRVGPGSDRATVLADHLERDTLSDPALRPGLHQEVHVCVGVDVDEARCHGETSSIELERSRRQTLPEAGDPVPSDRHVHDTTRAPGPIEYGATPQDEVDPAGGTAGRVPTTAHESDRGDGGRAYEAPSVHLGTPRFSRDAPGPAPGRRRAGSSPAAANPPPP
jgi:hypothetical protein